VPTTELYIKNIAILFDFLFSFEFNKNKPYKKLNPKRQTDPNYKYYVPI